MLRLPDPESYSAHGAFFTGALQLALSKTASPGEAWSFKPTGANLPRERLRQWLVEGQLDVLWSTTTPEREARYQPVRFNLLKGLNEQRYLLVRASDVKRFQAVRSLDDLRAFRAGAGTYWSDAQILRANGFTVETAPKNDSLYKMLLAGRFDFLPRAPDEIDVEVKAWAEQGLAQAPQLTIHYPQPMYFFTSREQAKLAERLQRGLELAAADGSYGALFMSVPSLRTAWQNARSFGGLRLMLDKPAGLAPDAAASR